MVSPALSKAYAASLPPIGEGQHFIDSPLSQSALSSQDGSNTFFEAPKALAEALAAVSCCTSIGRCRPVALTASSSMPQRALGNADTSLRNDHPDVCCKCDPFCCDPLCCDTKAVSSGTESSIELRLTITVRPRRVAGVRDEA